MMWRMEVCFLCTSLGLFKVKNVGEVHQQSNPVEPRPYGIARKLKIRGRQKSHLSGAATQK
jgi:hypothetical protein